MTPRRTTKSKGFTRRALLLGGAKVLMLGGLGSHLYVMQMQDTDKYRDMAEGNRIRLHPVVPPRGRILDRLGVIMADGTPTFQAFIEFSKEDDRNAALDMLKQILQLSESEVAKLRKDFAAARPLAPVLVRDELTWKELAALEEHTVFLPGVTMESTPSRFYPDGELAAHVIGYVGAPNDKDLEGKEDTPLFHHPLFRLGKTGIEKERDESLRGKAGVQQVEVNARGTPIRELSTEPAIPGTDLYLTIDKELQRFAMERLKGRGGLVSESAAAVVMDVDTGDVLTFASVPSFDPNRFVNGVSHAYWKELNENADRPMQNKVIGMAIPPGSVFKPLVGIGGLDSGKISRSTTFTCPGFFDFGNRRYHCWNRDGHGPVSLDGAVAGSCNVYFFNVGLRLGITKIAETARMFGYGVPTNIGLPNEVAGLMPDRDWKKRKLGEAWYDGETVNISIGQGYTQVTPMQLALSAARIASGKMVVPRVTFNPKETPPVFPDLPMDLTAVEAMRRAMAFVVNRPAGTSYRHRLPFERYAYSGKTGTVQVVGKTFKYTPELRHERYHAVFIGFAPVHKPKYAISVVVIHGGYGGAVAAPIARDLFLKVQEMADLRAGITPAYTYQQLVESGVPASDYDVIPPAPLDPNAPPEIPGDAGPGQAPNTPPSMRKKRELEADERPWLKKNQAPGGGGAKAPPSQAPKPQGGNQPGLLNGLFDLF